MAADLPDWTQDLKERDESKVLILGLRQQTQFLLHNCLFLILAVVGGLYLFPTAQPGTTYN